MSREKSFKPRKEALTAKDIRKIKEVVQYELKPVRDELCQAKKELRELKGKVDYLNGKMMFNDVE